MDSVHARIHTCTHTHTHTHTHTPMHTHPAWLSAVLQEFFLHLNLPQKVSYGSYHMLILCELAPINILVCITPWYTCMCMCVCVCVCMCVFEERQTVFWDCSCWAFRFCHGDQYCSVQGQVVWPGGPDAFVCLNWGCGKLDMGLLCC